MNGIESRAKAVYMMYVPDRFQSDRDGKLAVMAQLAIHCAEAATPRAAARILFGNISPSMTQTTTPQDRAKKRTKMCAAIRAVQPCAAGSLPSTRWYEKAQA